MGNGIRGGAVADDERKITTKTMKDVATYVDKVHISGKVVVSKMVKYHILTKFGVSIHRTTIGRMMKRLGLV